MFSDCVERALCSTARRVFPVKVLPAKQKTVFERQKRATYSCLASSPQIKQHPVKMQDISIGLQRLHQPLGTTKENCLVRGALKAKPVPTAGQCEGLTCALSTASELMEVTPPASADTSEEEEASVPAGPLPHLTWANSRELWKAMRAKDVSKMAPEQELRTLHPGILPSMRTILFDWLMEVCFVFSMCA